MVVASSVAGSCASFSSDAIGAALNRAADDILDAVDAPDEGVRDALNLLVNAAAHYLKDPEADLADVVTASYDNDLETVLGWIRTACCR